MIDLKGRYIKVLDNSSIKHYPCVVGDYILFRKRDKNYPDIEYWGIENKRSNYWGTNVHKNPQFELMPVGFIPPGIEPTYEIY